MNSWVHPKRLHVARIIWCSMHRHPVRGTGLGPTHTPVRLQRAMTQVTAYLGGSLGSWLGSGVAWLVPCEVPDTTLSLSLSRDRRDRPPAERPPVDLPPWDLAPCERPLAERPLVERPLAERPERLWPPWREWE